MNLQTPKHNCFIVIRELKKTDQNQCDELIRNYSMSFARTAFFAFLLKETTLQCVVISWAVLFIFFGVPLLFCTLILPICMVVMYLCVNITCHINATQSIKAQFTDCWVAEIYEPFLKNWSKTDFECDIFFNHTPYEPAHLARFKRNIIGTVSVKQHDALENSAWIYRYAVDSKYPLELVLESLLNYVLDECKGRRLVKAELVATEFQERERTFFGRKGFYNRQIYHKPIMGNRFSILKSQMGLELVNNYVENLTHANLLNSTDSIIVI